METNSYKGWLNSDNFFKRTIAVYLYSLLGNCTIGCIFYIIIFFLLMFTGMLGALSTMAEKSSVNQATPQLKDLNQGTQKFK